MKHVTASEARKNWFSLLDEFANGQIVAIERNGKKLVLRTEKRKKGKSYRKVISGQDIDNADKWGWDWDKAGRLIPITKK